MAKSSSASVKSQKSLSVRRIDKIHWYGLWMLYYRELNRVLTVFIQSILAPVVTTLLYLAIFYLALGGNVRTVGNMPFMQFLAPGLIMMTIIQNAFANTSTSILISKIQGNIVDTLMPPLGPIELLGGYALSGVTRGLMVGVGVYLAILLFVDMPVSSVPIILLNGLNGALMMSLIGIVGGIWAQRFEQNAVLTNFIITPLSFLSGTFYSISRLPEEWQNIAFINPFFYVIDGMRHGFLGISDADPVDGLIFVGVVNIALIVLCYRMFKTGYRLKS